MQSSLVSKFTRRVAFGVPGDQALPADPVAWASDQVTGLPPIDVLEPDGKRRQDLPTDMRLLWSMDEVMHAFEAHRQVEQASFQNSKSQSKAQFQAERHRTVVVPFDRPGDDPRAFCNANTLAELHALEKP